MQTTSPSDTSSAPVPSVPAKPNRKQRRGMASLQARQKRADEAATARRLSNFHVLQNWKEKQQTVSSEQAQLVFKAVLNSLFKKDFKNEHEFRRKLESVADRVLSGELLPDA